MMRFGIPKYRLPRDVLDAEMQRIVQMGVTLELNHKVADIRPRDDRRRLRRRLPRRRRAYRQARFHPGQGQLAHHRRGVGAAVDGGRGQADARPPRRRLRRRQHGDRRRAHRQASGRDRSRHRLPPNAREDAGAPVRDRGGAAGRRDACLAVDDRASRRRCADDREDDARREGHPAAHRRVRDPGGRLGGAGAGPGRRPLAARQRSRTEPRERRRPGRPDR